MEKQLDVKKILVKAWQLFLAEKWSWLLLIAGSLLIIIGFWAIAFYLFGVEALEAHPLYQFVIVLISALYYAMLHQNALDQAYNKPMHRLHLSNHILVATFFFIALTLHNPLTSMHGTWLVMLFPLHPMIARIVHLLLSYVVLRSMFIGMIVLHDHHYNPLVVVKKSFHMTRSYLFQLMAVATYVVLLFVPSFLIENFLSIGGVFSVGIFIACMIVGYFIVVSYTLLCKALFFKELHGK